MGDHIAQFTRAAKEIINQIMAQEDIQHLRPNLKKKSWLRGLGIKSHMTMLNLRINITENARKV